MDFDNDLFSTLYNGGTIKGSGAGGYGVNIGASAAMTNAAGGIIEGYNGLLFGGYGIVLNGGLINGDELGVSASSGGHIFNSASGTIEANTAVMLGGPGTVVNVGSIEGADYGIRLNGSGVVRNLETSSYIGGHYGVTIANAGYVLNAGTISGNGGTAIAFTGTGTNLLAVKPGAVFDGVVSAAGSANTLDLAAGKLGGTIGGLGTAFTGFDSFQVDAMANWTINGVNSLGSATTFLNQGTLIFASTNFTDSGTFTNNGTISVDPSDVTLADLFGSGTVFVGADSTLDVTGSVAAGETIKYAQEGGVFAIGDRIDMAGTISHWTFGDTIDLSGYAVSDVASVTITAGNTREIFATDGSSFDLQLDPNDNFSGLYATFTADAAGTGTALTVECFLRGTRIATPAGAVVVESLQKGDLVTTLYGGAAPVESITRRNFLKTDGIAWAKFQPICIAAGALAEGLPHRDFYVSPDHSIYLDSWLVPAKLLLNGSTIRQMRHHAAIEYFHVEVAPHDILFAEGAATESYLDIGNRWHVSAGGVIELGSMEEPKSWEDACAPPLLVGPQLAAIQQRLQERALPLGGPSEKHFNRRHP